MRSMGSSIPNQGARRPIHHSTCESDRTKHRGSGSVLPGIPRVDRTEQTQPIIDIDRLVPRVGGRRFFRSGGFGASSRGRWRGEGATTAKFGFFTRRRGLTGSAGGEQRDDRVVGVGGDLAENRFPAVEVRGVRKGGRRRFRGGGARDFRGGGGGFVCGGRDVGVGDVQCSGDLTEDEAQCSSSVSSGGAGCGGGAGLAARARPERRSRNSSLSTASPRRARMPRWMRWSLETTVTCLGAEWARTISTMRSSATPPSRAKTTVIPPTLTRSGRPGGGSRASNTTVVRDTSAGDSSSSSLRSSRVRARSSSPGR